MRHSVNRGLAALLLLCASSLLLAQQAPTGFTITQTTPPQTSFNGVPGFGGNYPAGNTYNLRFGQQPNGDPGVNAQVSSFAIGTQTFSRVLPAAPGETPFDRVVINRVNNSNVDYDKVTAFFCQPQELSGTVPSGTTVFFNCGWVDTMEALINSFVLNRGSDNLFANANSATLNNIERVDMILDQGLGSTAPASTGFLLMERGGNDNFAVAAITRLDASGKVAQLGPLVQANHTGQGGVWGSTGVNIRSTVFQSVPPGDTEPQPLLRPSQNLGQQLVHGTYISFADLGIPAGQAIFGIALFPGDVTSSMNLIDLVDVPLNTSGDSAAGGLDFMAGGGFFIDDDLDPPLPNFLTADVSCEGSSPDPIQLEARVENAGSVEFFYWQEGVSSAWTPVQPVAGQSNPTSPTASPQFELDWDTSGIDFNAGQSFQIRIKASASFNLAIEETVLAFDADGCSVTGVPVSLAHVATRQRGEQLLLDFSTSMEVGNVGFNVYGRLRDGSLQRLNDGLLPSQAVDSVDPLDYQWSGRVRGVQEVYLEDVDVLGRAQLHGPFRLNEQYGLKPQPEAIDWATIRASETQRQARQQSTFAGLSRQPLRLLVDQDGIYSVSYEQLLADGYLDGPVQASRLSLTRGRQPVGLDFDGVHRGFFGPGASLQFLGLAEATLYSDTAVYQLRLDAAGARPQVDSSRRVSLDGSADNPGNGRLIGGRGLVGQAESSHVETVHFGRERVYNFASPSGSPWADTRMVATNNPRQWHFDFAVDALEPGSWGGVLEVSLSGVTDWPGVELDHRVQISLNSQLLADEWFGGQIHHPVSLRLPAGLLKEGNNRLTLRMPADTGADADVVNLDHFRVRYPRLLQARHGELQFDAAARLLEVAGLDDPQPAVYRLVDGRAERVQPAGLGAQGRVLLASDGQHARWFVAASSALRSPALEPGRPFVDITSGRTDYLMVAHPAFIDGLAPLVDFHQSRGLDVRVVNVLDIYDQFSDGRVDAHAIRDYIRATAGRMGYGHVLLVGGDTMDYRNTLGTGSISFVPSLYAETGSLVRYAPADALMVDLDGNGVPDLPIGRLPVRSAQELEAVISKTLDYHQRPAGRSLLMAADRAEPGLSFSSMADNLLSPLERGWTIERAYIDQSGVPGARSALLSGLNAGPAVTGFLGHSSYSVWTFDGLFASSDIANLANAGLPTAVIQWGCWNSYHVSPNYNTLGHRFLLAPERGAAVSIGSATLSQVRSNRLIGEILLPKLQQQPELTIGQLLTQAKRDLADRPGDTRDVVLGWSILGDPALRLPPATTGARGRL